MAQHVRTVLTCDWPHGGKEVEATTTVHLTVEGMSYETDCCDTHAERVQRTIAQVTEHARTMRRTATTAKPQRATRNGKAHATSREVRDWAKAEGLWTRGRVSKHIIERYEEAHATPTA